MKDSKAKDTLELRIALSPYRLSDSLNSCLAIALELSKKSLGLDENATWNRSFLSERNAQETPINLFAGVLRETLESTGLKRFGHWTTNEIHCDINCEVDDVLAARALVIKLLQTIEGYQAIIVVSEAQTDGSFKTTEVYPPDIELSLRPASLFIRFINQEVAGAVQVSEKYELDKKTVSEALKKYPLWVKSSSAQWLRLLSSEIRAMLSAEISEEAVGVRSDVDSIEVTIDCLGEEDYAILTNKASRTFQRAAG